MTIKKQIYKTDQNNPQIRAYKAAIEKGKQNQHVLPRGDGWVVKKAGAEKPSHIFRTQIEAAKQAIAIAQNQGTAVFIHDTDGRIRDRRDY